MYGDGGGAGNSMLLSLTTSPEGDDKISSSQLKGSKGKSNERISDLLSRGDENNGVVWDLESSFEDDNMPDSLKLPSTRVEVAKRRSRPTWTLAG